MSQPVGDGLPQRTPETGQRCEGERQTWPVRTTVRNLPWRTKTDKKYNYTCSNDWIWLRRDWITIVATIMYLETVMQRKKQQQEFIPCVNDSVYWVTGTNMQTRVKAKLVVLIAPHDMRFQKPNLKKHINSRGGRRWEEVKGCTWTSKCPIFLIFPIFLAPAGMHPVEANYKKVIWGFRFSGLSGSLLTW